MIKNMHKQFGVNREPRRTQNPLLPLLPPVQIALLLTIVFVCSVVRAQCYIDPYTGQRICTRPAGNGPPAAGPSRQVIAESPNGNAGAASVDAAAHCRISVDDGTLGSGTLVARDRSVGLILTCAHLFDSSTSRIVVTFPHGGQFAARLVDVDRAHDLAAIVIRRPEIEPLSIGDGEPAGVLTACGFGSNGVFHCVQGGITGHPTAVGATYPSTTIVGAVRPGDSGGGVLDTRGQVVGVVWGQRDGQTYATCGRPVCEFLNRIRGSLFPNRNGPSTAPITSPQPSTPSPQPDWQAFTSELDARIRALDAKKQDKGDYLQHGDLNGYLRAEEASKLTGPLALRTEVEGKLSALSTRFESVHSVVESVRQSVAQVAGDRGGFLQGVSIGKVAVGTLGLSGPLGAAIVVAGGLAGFGVKSRLRRLESRISSPALDPRPSTLNARPIAVDSPPPPQRSVPETHYVPVEKDSFAKAHQWASEHVVRKYPGATEVLQAQDSLIKQFLAGKP